MLTPTLEVQSSLKPYQDTLRKSLNERSFSKDLLVLAFVSYLKANAETAEQLALVTREIAIDIGKTAVEAGMHAVEEAQEAVAALELALDEAQDYVIKQAVNTAEYVQKIKKAALEQVKEHVQEGIDRALLTALELHEHAHDSTWKVGAAMGYVVESINYVCTNLKHTYEDLKNVTDEHKRYFMTVMNAKIHSDEAAVQELIHLRLAKNSGKCTEHSYHSGVARVVGKFAGTVEAVVVHETDHLKNGLSILASIVKHPLKTFQAGYEHGKQDTHASHASSVNSPVVNSWRVESIVIPDAQTVSVNEMSRERLESLHNTA